MPMEDDDRPRKKITHEIGQDLSLLSVEELNERIALLTAEAERLREAAGEEARVEGCREQFFQDVVFVVPDKRSAASWPDMTRPSRFFESSAPQPVDAPRAGMTREMVAATRPMADMANRG